MIELTNIFVTSDIHGHMKHFEELLQHWNQEDQLIIIGDLIDRGPESVHVIRKVMQLVEQFGGKVTFLKGNHEDMLLNFLANPIEKEAHYYLNGGKETMDHFFQLLNIEQPASIEQVADLIKTNFEAELNFLQNAPLFKQIGKVLFTHAGFNSEFDSIEHTTEREFIWIRKHFLQPNKLGLVNVFGHTPVKYIYDNNNIWYSEDKQYIAIDGGCYMTGQLNALLLNEEGATLAEYNVQLPIAESKYD